MVSGKARALLYGFCGENIYRFMWSLGCAGAIIYAVNAFNIMLVVSHSSRQNITVTIKSSTFVESLIYTAYKPHNKHRNGSSAGVNQHISE